ncbi:MAG: class I SAM-dependent methyltransferase [Candidatus Omnitrophica bacterium]|nr:class I SAM-dependent methyltransferase [Candidatus Omnitrophota bacterium]
MRETILDVLKCPECGNNSLLLEKEKSDELEVRLGRVVCGNCQAQYLVRDGIIDFLSNANEFVLRERKAMDEDEYVKDESGKKHRITGETILKFKDKFLALPEGDGSAFFQAGGSFQSTAEASARFYSAMEGMHLKGTERILEIGACFSYASFKFAQKGCKVVALDISNYLKVADLYVKKAHFERVFSDMHKMPFQDNSFDIVFGSAILHHSKKLKEVFKEIRRILSPGGNLVLINEAARGVLEKVHPVFKEMEEKGFQDTSYTVPQFKQAARAAGFKRVKIVFSSLADDYVTKHKNRNSKRTFKVSLAYFFKQHKKLENIVLFFMVPSRLLSRPKSWKLIGYKNGKN